MKTMHFYGNHPEYQNRTGNVVIDILIWVMCLSGSFLLNFVREINVAKYMYPTPLMASIDLTVVETIFKIFVSLIQITVLLTGAYFSYRKTSAVRRVKSKR